MYEILDWKAACRILVQVDWQTIIKLSLTGCGKVNKRFITILLFKGLILYPIQ